MPDFPTTRSAEAANFAWNDSKHDVQKAYDAAYAYAQQHDAEIPVNEFRIDTDGTVHLRLYKTATTLVVQRIGPLEKYADISATGSASTPQQ